MSDEPTEAEKLIELEARLLAIESLLCSLLVNFYEARGLSDDAVKRAHDKLKQQAMQLSPGSDDPAVNALFSGALEEQIGRLLREVDANWKELRRGRR